MAKGKAKVKKTKVEVVTVNETQMDEAVTWINDKITNNVHGTYLEIGNYVFESLFGGDLEQIKSYNPQKESSFRKLAEREDLLISKSNLHRAVQVAIQEKLLLPTVPAMGQLTFTHKVLLLPLKNEKKKKLLATKVAEENLTTRELEQLVKEAKEEEPKSSAGRPTLPGFLKSVKKGYNIFGKEGALSGLTEETLSGLKKDKAIELREKTKHILSTVSQIDEALSKVIEGD